MHWQTNYSIRVSFVTTGSYEIIANVNHKNGTYEEVRSVFTVFLPETDRLLSQNLTLAQEAMRNATQRAVNAEVKVRTLENQSASLNASVATQETEVRRLNTIKEYLEEQNRILLVGSDETNAERGTARTPVPTFLVPVAAIAVALVLRKRTN